jgi:hypothetical protein
MRRALVVVLTLSAAACTVPDWKTEGRITRYTKIAKHRFDPAQLTVPADTPFWLAIDGYDDVTTLVISSKDLGIPRQRIRAHVHSTPRPETDPPERARLPVGALPPGRYEFMCECHGEPAIGVIVATSSGNQ